MGALLFRRAGHLGFVLTILLALSPCYGNHVTLNVDGFIECAHCISVGVTSSEASPGTGRHMTVHCKSTDGDLRTLGVGDIDEGGSFKIKFLQNKIPKDQVQRGSCFLKLEGSPGAPCPGQKVQNVFVMIFKSIDNVKRTSALIRKLKFASITCTSTVLWPYDKNNELLIHIPPSPGKSFDYPQQPSVKAFLSPKSGPMEVFPQSVKTFDTSLPPPGPLKKNWTPSPTFMSRKLLTWPIPFFIPIFRPFPIVQYPSPVLAPAAGNPPPTPIPTINKPLPPPTPTSYEPSPAPSAISVKPLPPPAPTLEKPVLAPPPESKTAPPPHFQKLVPPTAPPPMFKKPHLPPLTPTCGNPISVPPPTPHLKKPLPPVPPAPTYKKPTISPPTPHLKKPHPPVPPAPTYKKPTISPPMHSPGPILQKPKTPPVPKFKKSAPPRLPSIPVQQPSAPARPISPSPLSHPSPKPAHKSAPSPPTIVNPTPPTKEPLSQPPPPRNSFSPIPKAPPIPKLPPVPTVPRRYFNSPKTGSRPPSPPS